jgi:UPF0716 protein FxsA
VLVLLVLLFVVVPLAELYVIIQVGQAIGALPTIALLVLDSILGGMLMRSQGRLSWMRFRLALEEGRVPGREVLDGALVIFGGAFLLTPGFLTDIIGAVLLIPPTRDLVRRGLVRRFTVRMLGGTASPRPRGSNGGRGGAAFPGSGYDVEGTATEVDPDRHRLP